MKFHSIWGILPICPCPCPFARVWFRYINYMYALYMLYRHRHEVLWYGEWYLLHASSANLASETNWDIDRTNLLKGTNRENWKYVYGQHLFCWQQLLFRLSGFITYFLWMILSYDCLPKLLWLSANGVIVYNFTSLPISLFLTLSPFGCFMNFPSASYTFFATLLLLRKFITKC